MLQESLDSVVYLGLSECELEQDLAHSYYRFCSSILQFIPKQSLYVIVAPWQNWGLESDFPGVNATEESKHWDIGWGMTWRGFLEISERWGDMVTFMCFNSVHYCIPSSLSVIGKSLIQLGSLKQTFLLTSMSETSRA